MNVLYVLLSDSDLAKLKFLEFVVGGSIVGGYFHRGVSFFPELFPRDAGLFMLVSSSLFDLHA